MALTLDSSLQSWMEYQSREKCRGEGWLNDSMGARWREISSCFSVSCPVGVRHHKPWLSLPRHTGLPHDPGHRVSPGWHMVLQQGWSPAPHSPDQTWAPQSQAHMHSLSPAPSPGMCQMPSAGAALVSLRCCSYLEVGQALGEFLREQNWFLRGLCIRAGFVPSCLIPCPHCGCLQPVIPAAGRVQEPRHKKCQSGSGSSQHSLLPAGCTDTFTLCRSCPTPCLRTCHSRGRTPACVKSSWDMSVLWTEFLEVSP